jgi:FkbM family methyltransferase
MRDLVFAFYKFVRNRFRGLGLGKIPGVLKLSTAIYKFSRPKGIALFEVDGHRLYVDCSNIVIGSIYGVGGNWEADPKRFFESRLRAGMTVVDIGANIGDYALVAAKAVGERGRIYAFEPDPGNYDLLVRNARANRCTNILPCNMAISNCTGELTLYVDAEDSGRQSLAAGNVKVMKRSITVKSETLDHFFENIPHKPDFLKIDAQGAEGLIIDGAKALLQTANFQMIIEFWPFGLEKLGTEPESLLNLIQNYHFQLGIISGCKCRRATISEVLEACAANPYMDLFCEKVDH